MIKHKLTQEQISYNKGIEQQIAEVRGKILDTTLSITGVAKKQVFRGFRVIVGIKKGSGMFEYSKGNRKKAQKLGEVMRKIERRLGVFKHKKDFYSFRAVRVEEVRYFLLR